MKKIEDLKYEHLNNFRFRCLKNGHFILTNDGGDWVDLEAEKFSLLIQNKIKSTDPIYQELKEKQFLKLDEKGIVSQAIKYLNIHSSAYTQSTTLFILVLTLRCNHRCLYCQATPEAPNAKGVDMSEITAKKTLDLIFRSPSLNINLELQGGEPTLNWDVLEFIVKYSTALAGVRNKKLRINLVSNFTLLDEDKLKFLLDYKVSLCCSLDGPAEVHDKNRPYLGRGGSYTKVVRQIKKANRIIAQRAKKSPDSSYDKVNAITTVSKFSLPFAKEIIDEYVKLGFNNIFLRPLSPFGLDKKTYQMIGCKVGEFIRFYLKALDHILELNLKGVDIIERNLFYALSKIMKKKDPVFYDSRDPCGAGIGQMAFNFDGKIYTCDEGRMAARMGHEDFELGNVSNDRFEDLIDHEVTKTMCMASCLDNQAGCSDCVYKPYCGVCPLLHYIQDGTIFPQMPSTDQCKIKMAMFDYIFSKLKVKKYREIFENWVKRV